MGCTEGVGVSRSGRFMARPMRDGKVSYLGTFSTAEEAALVVARDAREHGVDSKERLTAAEAEGLTLERSATLSSGYKGVYVARSRFQARFRRDGTNFNLGNFDTAEEAALARSRKLGVLRAEDEPEPEDAISEQETEPADGDETDDDGEDDYGGCCDDDGERIGSKRCRGLCSPLSRDQRTRAVRQRATTV